MRRDDEGPYSLETLRALGAPAIFTRDAATLRARYVTYFEASTGRKLYEGQVEMLMIETLAYAMSLLGEEAQATAEEHLVAYASNAGLDRLGPNRSTPRLPAAAARVTLRFTLGSSRGVQTPIPAGTRVRDLAGTMGFLTLADAAIPAGETSVDVFAEAEGAGARSNTIPDGALEILASPIAGVSVTNPAAPSGGADAEGAELYRLRLANAFERISGAGPRAGYRERAMGVSAAIVDAAVVRPAPCEIEIYLLTADGGAGEALCAAVLAALDPEVERPLGDDLTVLPAEAVTMAITVTVRVTGGVAVVQPLAEAAIAAVLTDWRQRLGARLSPAALEEPVFALAGVVDVGADLAYTQLGPHQYLEGTATVDVLVVA